MEKVQIKVMDNGSYRVTGDVELIDVDGNVFENKESFLTLPLWPFSESRLRWYT